MPQAPRVHCCPHRRRRMPTAVLTRISAQTAAVTTPLHCISTSEEIVE